LVTVHPAIAYFRVSRLRAIAKALNDRGRTVRGGQWHAAGHAAD
jgi:hypothetical protein